MKAKISYSKKDSSRSIVFFCKSLEQLRVAVSVCNEISAEKRCLVYFHDKKVLLETFSFSQNKNIYLCSDIKVIFYAINTFEALIVFGGLMHPGHEKTNYIVDFFKDAGVPTFDFQHGLIQWGVNFSDNSRVAGFDNSSGFPLDMRSNCDNSISWFSGEDAVGYPEIKSNLIGNDDDVEKILILSNMNWHIYSDVERSSFLGVVVDMVSKNPLLRFRWRPHPAEFHFNHAFKAFYDVAKKFPNLEIVDPNFKNVSEDIFWATKVISTVSTVIVDVYLSGKPVVIYCGANWFSGIEDVFTAQFSTKREFFNDFIKGRNLPKRLLINGYKSFDSKAFLNIIDGQKVSLTNKSATEAEKLYKEYIEVFGSSSSGVDKNILDSLNKLNSELMKVGKDSHGVKESMATMNPWTL